MVKKIITIILILASIVAMYSIICKRTIYHENVFLARHCNIDDIIVLNRKHLYEMADDRIKTSISEFKDLFPCDVDVQIRPLAEKSSSSHVLWGNGNNDKMRIIFYEKDKVIYTEQVNVWLLAYTMYSEIVPWTFEEYMNDNEVVERLKRNEKNNPRGFTFLSGCNPELPDSVYRQIHRTNVTVNEYLAIYNAAMLHYSLLHFYLHKLKGVNKNFYFGIVDFATIDRNLEELFKERVFWPVAFQEYHFKKHWLRYELIYYSNLFLFLLLIVAIIFFFIQFFRKNLKVIIKEELAKNGVTLTFWLVYKIFWQNWKCLFYQSRDKNVQARIGIIAKKIADDIRNKNVIRRAKELWEVFNKAELPEQTKGALFGNYKKAIAKKTSFANRCNAVNVLSNHLSLLSRGEDRECNKKIIDIPKKERGISEKDKLYSQIHELISIHQDILDGLSTNNLYHFILAIEILPKIDPFALEKMIAAGVKKMLNNNKFIDALHTEDKFIIKELLGLEKFSNSDYGNGDRDRDRDRDREEVVISNKLLEGKKVVIIGGYMAHPYRYQYVEWTSFFNAKKVSYVSALKSSKIMSVCHSKTVDLAIVVLPVNHSVSYKLKADFSKNIILMHRHCSKGRYLEQLNKGLIGL